MSLLIEGRPVSSEQARVRSEQTISNPEFTINSVIGRVLDVRRGSHSVVRNIGRFDDRELAVYQSSLVDATEFVHERVGRITNPEQDTTKFRPHSRAQKLHEHGVGDVIAHDFSNDIARYGFNLYALREEFSPELAAKTVTDIFDSCTQASELFDNPFPMQRLSASEIHGSLQNYLGLPDGHALMDPQLEQDTIQFSSFWLRSLGKNLRQNVNRASSLEKQANLGFSLRKDVFEDKQSLVIDFLDDAGGFPDEILENGFNGTHGYKRTDSNQFSTGVAMQRLDHIITKGYGGTLTAENVVYSTKTKGALLSVSFPLAA